NAAKPQRRRGNAAERLQPIRLASARRLERQVRRARCPVRNRLESIHDPQGMHRVRLRPVSVPGLQQQEITPAKTKARSTPSFAGRGPPATGGSPPQTPCLPCRGGRNWWQSLATVRK